MNQITQEKKSKVKNPTVRFKEPKKRMPRPWGLTALASAYHLVPDTQPAEKQEKKLNLINHTINLYLQQGMILCQEVYNISSLSQALNMDLPELQTHLNNQLTKRGTMFDDGYKGAQWAREIFQTSIFQAAENQALTRNQVHILAKAQGTKYVPFLSSALNQALGNLTAAQRPMQELLKMLLTNTPTYLNPATDGDSNGQPKQYLSPEMAMNLIAQNEPSLLEDSNKLAAKELELGNLPEVDARYQNLTNIGINHDGSQVPKEPTEASTTPRTIHTDIRNTELIEVESADEFIG